jgi:hypothetical protein
MKKKIQKKHDKNINEDDVERWLSLKEHELTIKECEVKIWALELANIEKEKELGL